MRPKSLAMLQVDLSTLRGPELRQLLDSARQRGQAALSYEILQEMAARRERREREGPRPLFQGRRGAEPRMIEMNLGDPRDPQDDEADWDDPGPPPEPLTLAPPPAAAHDDLPPPGEAIFLHRPAEPEPEAAADAVAEAETAPARAPRRPGRWPWAAAGLAIGLAGGAAVGWWAGQLPPEPPPPPDAPAAVLAAAQPAPQAAAPAPAPPLSPEPNVAAEPPPEPAAPIPAPETREASASTPDAQAAAQETAESAATTAAAQPAPEPVKIAPAGPKGCAGQAAPADRTICETPSLQRLQRELRRTYAEALDAHADRALLREHQLAWRDARNDVSDPARLARLYEQRIRKLNAATADARRRR